MHLDLGIASVSRDPVERHVVAESHLDLERVVVRTVIGLSLLAIVTELVVGFAYLNWASTDWGGDLRYYTDATRRWLAGEAFYLPRQLAGPYEIQMGDILYPPTAIYLFLPFVFLPSQLWWALAIVIPAYAFWVWRPAGWAIALICLCLAVPNLPNGYFRGSPAIMVAALVAAGLLWKWPGALILLKPSVFPFALIGIRSRGWWITIAVLGLITLPVVTLVPDWIRVVIDGRSPAGWLYSLRDVPLLLVPVIAYLGRSRTGRPTMGS